MSFDAPSSPQSGTAPEPGALPGRVPRTLGGPAVEASTQLGGAGGEPPRRRPGAALLLPLAAIAAAAALFWSGLLGGGGGGPLNPIAEAAEKTLASPGARITINASIEGLPAGASMAMRGEGVFSGESGRGRMSLVVSVRGVPGPSEMRLAMLTDGTDAYIGSDRLPAELTGGKRWLLVRDAGGFDADAFGQSDPRDQLGQLESVSDNATLVGRERLDGVAVDHYAATIDLEREAERLRDGGEAEAADAVGRAIELLGTRYENVEVWIDGKGLVRRVRVSLPFEALGQVARMELTMDLSDFGVEPRIELPPQEQVYDATGQLEGGFEGLLG